MKTALRPQGAVDHSLIVLRTGEAAELRPVTEADRRLVSDLLGRQSADDLDHRFLAMMSPEAQLHTVMRPVGQPHSVTLAVLVSRGDAREMVAIGSIGEDVATRIADLGLLVDARYQHRGVGTILVERLAILALEDGMDQLTALTRWDNRTMLHVLAEVGFPQTIESFRDTAGDVRVSLDIRDDAMAVRRFAERDRAAAVSSLAAILTPRAVAVVGVSASDRGIGRKVLKNLQASGTERPLYVVHREVQAIAGTPAVPSIADLPDGVDLLVVAVPRDGVVDVIRQAGRRGIAAAVILSAGFGETGEAGRLEESRLRTAAREAGIRIVGPNCLGVVNTNPLSPLNASFLPAMPPRGRIALASQSGALGIAMVETARRQHLGISSFVSLGNKVDLSSNDLLQFWEQDPDTAVIVLYLESFGNPQRFARLARRVSRQKPILLVKAGRSPGGARAASAHTAAMVTNDAVVDALTADAGIVRAETLEDLFDLATLLVNQPLPRGGRTAVITNGGGPGVLAMDALQAGGLDPVPASEATESHLRALIPSAASLQNPFDLLASADADAYRAATRAVLAAPEYDAALVIVTPILGETSPDEVLRAVEEEAEKARGRRAAKPVLLVVLDGPGPSAVPTTLPTYRFPEGAARALASARRYAAWLEMPETPLPTLALTGLNLEIARALMRSAEERLGPAGGWLAPLESYHLMHALGIPVVMPRWASTPGEVSRAATDFGGPVAIKMVSPTLIHKSEWGGVALGVEGGMAAAEAAERMRAHLVAVGQGRALQGFLVQPMVPAGLECLVGMTSDAQFGPVLAVGLGGIQAEAIADAAVGLSPIGEETAWSMVSRLRGHRLLEGARGAPARDRQALVDILLRLSAFVEAFDRVRDVDLNPVIVGTEGSGARVVDVRIRVGSDAETTTWGEAPHV